MLGRCDRLANEPRNGGGAGSSGIATLSSSLGIKFLLQKKNAPHVGWGSARRAKFFINITKIKVMEENYTAHATLAHAYTWYHT